MLTWIFTMFNPENSTSGCRTITPQEHRCLSGLCRLRHGYYFPSLTCRRPRTAPKWRARNYSNPNRRKGRDRGRKSSYSRGRGCRGPCRKKHCTPSSYDDPSKCWRLRTPDAHTVLENKYANYVISEKVSLLSISSVSQLRAERLEARIAAQQVVQHTSSNAPNDVGDPLSEFQLREVVVSDLRAGP